MGSLRLFSPYVLIILFILLFICCQITTKKKITNFWCQGSLNGKPCGLLIRFRPIYKRLKIQQRIKRYNYQSTI